MLAAGFVLNSENIIPVEAFIALFSILYTVWPLIFLFGIRALFTREKPFLTRFRIAIINIFIGWLVWAFFLGYLRWHGQTPYLIFSPLLDTWLFFGTGFLTGGFTLWWLISRWRKKRIRWEDAQNLEGLLAMEPDAFEALVAALFKAYRHETMVAGGNGDHGVDVIVKTDEGEKWVVQCKRYSGSVGEPVVRDLYGTMLHEEAQRAYLITTGSFTRQATEWAVGKPIVLYNGEGLVKLIRRTQKAKAHKAI